jgi:non-canonical poly(A) RNA polymerase PAPD5/7
MGSSHKHREGRDQVNADADAGPSNVSTAATKRKRKIKGKDKGSGSVTPIPQGEQKPLATVEEPSFENNGDFIAFGLEPANSHDLDEDEKEPRKRDWNKGKGKGSEHDAGGGSGGKKRKADFNRNDGYNNKKERTNAASRKAPWVANVDWEGSVNVAELYAVFCLRGAGELG